MPEQQKLLKPTIEAIYGILRMENCKVCGVEGIPSVNRIAVNAGHFDLMFETYYPAVSRATMPEDLPSLRLVTEQTSYDIPQGNAYFEGTIVADPFQKQSFDLRFGRIIQSGFEVEKDYYWRFVYPVGSSEWFMKVQGEHYQDDYNTRHFWNLIPLELDAHKLNIFESNVDGNHWMIIESTESISYDEMDHRVQAITAALGLVIGKRYGDYRFQLASCDELFAKIAGVSAVALQKTKNCPFRILSTDNNGVEMMLKRFEYQQYALNELKQDGNVRWFYNDEGVMTKDALGKLAQLCYKSNDMMIATCMLVDGSLINIEYQKPFFHVVLETITSALLDNDNVTLPPTMPQDEYQHKVQPVLQAALDGISDLGDEAKSVFSSRIEHNLNTAPNSNKLEACFPKYGYTLTKADKDAIKKRNSTFHGHLTDKDHALNDQQYELFAMSLRLHKLCSILLLKEAGFSGKVLNNEVLFGMKQACGLEEPVFIEI